MHELVKRHWILAAGLVVAGCASPQAPTRDLKNASGAIRAAEEINANEYPQASLHLILARDLIQQTATNGSEKGQLLDRWHKHRQEYAQALEELRQQRQKLEMKHLEVEGRLIERRLQ